jgi:cytochrome c oxidase assembly protein subunit 15
MQSLHFLQLALTGLLVALLPLALVWVSNDPNKYRKLVWVTLFFTFDLIVFGAFTRLTDSGLGCPDWPGCYGHANPMQAHAQIRAAEALMPTGPVTLTKAWIEMTHRYLAMAIGVLIVAMVAAAWRAWLKTARRNTGFSPWLPMGLLFFVCVQGAFGKWTVTMKLQPAIVTMHLLLGMGLLAMLGWQAARVGKSGAQRGLMPDASAGANALLVRRLRPWALLAGAVLLVQIALGGWVSTNYAALACGDFPLCQGALMPPMDWAHGFSLWRELGKTAAGDFLPFPALTAIHWVHRSFALLVFVVLGWLGYRAQAVPTLRPLARVLLLVLVLQVASGMATVFFAWPLAIAVLHNAGAALLVLVLTMLNYRIRYPISICSQPGSVSGACALA